MSQSQRFSHGLSFDDVLLRPERSNALPRDVSKPPVSKAKIKTNLIANRSGVLGIWADSACINGDSAANR